MSHELRRSEEIPEQAKVSAERIESRRGSLLSAASGSLGSAMLQRKIVQRMRRRAESAERAPTADEAGRAAVEGTRGGGGALPHLEAIQRSFGRHDVGGVQAHTDEAAADAAHSIGARAFATGQHVAFAGAPDLHTAAHEAAHVVQQRGGVQLAGGVDHDGDPFERHADEVADRVVEGRSSEALLDRHAGGAGSASGGATASVQRLKYTRFGGLFGSFKSYSQEEIKLNQLEGKVAEFIEEMRPHEHDLLSGDEIVAARLRFETIRDGSHEQTAYETVREQLQKILEELDNSSSKIAARLGARSKKLTRQLGDSLEVVESSEDKKAPNQVTRLEMTQIHEILDEIYVREEGTIQLQLGSLDTYNLAQRSRERDLPVPDEVTLIELQVQSAIRERERKDQDLGDKMGKVQEKLEPLQRNKSRSSKEEEEFEELKKEFKELKGQYELLDTKKEDALKRKYKGLVGELVKEETMRDLVKIAQTQVGRDLLVSIAAEKLKENAKKIILSAREEYSAPTAGPDSKGNATVNYTPQALRDRDTVNRAEEGALPRLKALEDHNAWQENGRSDITLFHEMVHAQHILEGTAKDKGAIVSKEDVSDEVDAPYKIGEEVNERGVSEEEYFTVGLGKYEGAKFTENKYRAERNKLGEDVEKRGHYTHKDKHGKRVGDNLI